jgi:hypothetical protein
MITSIYLHSLEQVVNFISFLSLLIMGGLMDRLLLDGGLLMLDDGKVFILGCCSILGEIFCRNR